MHLWANFSDIFVTTWTTWWLLMIYGRSHICPVGSLWPFLAQRFFETGHWALAPNGLKLKGSMQFLKVAHFAILTEGYNKDEIARAEGGDYWTVNVTLRIVSFLEVREIFFIICRFKIVSLIILGMSIHKAKGPSPPKPHPWCILSWNSRNLSKQLLFDSG